MGSCSTRGGAWRPCRAPGAFAADRRRVTDAPKGGDVEQTAIFGPFFATMLLTLVVWVYMYARRIPFLTNSGIEPNSITALELARMSPPEVANPSDNLKNLFEIPTLFYAVALYLFATNQVDFVYVVAGWVFAVFRILHSAVHCTVNIVMLRFYLYLISTLAVWFIVIRAALAWLLRTP
jgi:hypothetical protein